MFDDLGAKFWLTFFGMMIAAAIILFVFMMLFTRATYQWGILGGILLIAGFALVASRIWDRRHNPDRSLKT